MIYRGRGAKIKKYIELLGRGEFSAMEISEVLKENYWRVKSMLFYLRTRYDIIAVKKDGPVLLFTLKEGSNG